MKKILLSTAAAVAIATTALSFGATTASAGYYNYTSSYQHSYEPVCHTKYKTVSYRKKIKVRRHHGYGYGYGYGYPRYGYGWGWDPGAAAARTDTGRRAADGRGTACRASRPCRPRRSARSSANGWVRAGHWPVRAARSSRLRPVR